MKHLENAHWEKLKVNRKIIFLRRLTMVLVS